MKPVTKIGLIVTTVAFIIAGVAHRVRRKSAL